MPLVVITGLPASGKSTRAAQIKEYLEKEHNKTVHIVSDNEVITASNLSKNALYLGNFSKLSLNTANFFEIWVIKLKPLIYIQILRRRRKYGV